MHTPMATSSDTTAKQSLRLCYSPCPNDTFIFYGLAHGRVDAAPYAFDIALADVEELNRRAAAGAVEVCKVSASAAAGLVEDWWILAAGGALGFGCGPLVVTHRPCDFNELRDQPLAIPGRMTTAHLLLQLHGVHRGPVVEMSYERIMPAVARGEVAAGLIIHEGRFTYAAAGLHLALDLGVWWEQTIGLPLPLGVIVAKRSLGRAAALRIEAAIRDSLRYGRSHAAEAMHYVRSHAQELDEQVIGRHIQSFVNDLSLDPGASGRQSIALLLKKAAALAGRPLPDITLFPG